MQYVMKKSVEPPPRGKRSKNFLNKLSAYAEGYVKCMPVVFVRQYKSNRIYKTFRHPSNFFFGLYKKEGLSWC